MPGTVRFLSEVLCRVPAQTLREAATAAGLLFAMAEAMHDFVKSLRTNAVGVEMEESMTDAPIWATELALRWTGRGLSPTL